MLLHQAQSIWVLLPLLKFIARMKCPSQQADLTTTLGHQLSQKSKRFYLENFIYQPVGHSSPDPSSPSPVESLPSLLLLHFGISCTVCDSVASAKLTVEYIHIYDLFVKIITVSQFKNTEKYFYED